jgi:hypothetical protein
MLTIDTMPGNARVWIYQADRMLSVAEQESLTQAALQFVAGWAAHGSPLAGSAQVLKGYFLVIAVDEEQAAASGCSIDKSVHFVKAVGAQFGVDFFNRMNIAVENPELTLVPLANFDAEVAKGGITPDTFVYDNTVTTVADFKNRWFSPAKNTWLARYFATQTA